MTPIALFNLDKRKTPYTVIPKQETFLASSRRCSSAVRATQLGCAISLHLRVRELGKTCGFESPPRREGFLDWDWAVRSWPPLFFLLLFSLFLLAFEKRLLRSFIMRFILSSAKDA